LHQFTLITDIENTKVSIIYFVPSSDILVPFFGKIAAKQICLQMNLNQIKIDNDIKPEPLEILLLTHIMKTHFIVASC